MEQVIHFLDSRGAQANYSNMFMKEFSKTLINQVYTWYANLKREFIHDREHLVLYLIPNSFAVKSHFILTWPDAPNIEGKTCMHM